MSIKGDGIAIKAFDQAGAFYAVQSIFGLVDSQNVFNHSVPFEDPACGNGIINKLSVVAN